MSDEEIEDMVRNVAYSLPPSDFGSHRAIRAMTEAIKPLVDPSLYAQGFHDGMQEAARTLREAAEDHRNQSRECKKVLEAQAHELAAALLGSWANGLEMNASKALNK